MSDGGDTMLSMMASVVVCAAGAGAGAGAGCAIAGGGGGGGGGIVIKAGPVTSSATVPLASTAAAEPLLAAKPSSQTTAIFPGETSVNS